MFGRWLDKGLKKVGIDGGDLAVFLLSLLLSVSMWLGHNLSLQYSSLVTVSVVAQSGLEGRAYESSNSCAIVARCRTSGYNLLSKNMGFSRKLIKVHFSPEDLHFEGADSYSISSVELAAYVNDIFGDDVRLESFVTPSVQFIFPKENHKTVPISAISDISYKAQYTAMSALTLTPDSVTVYGEPSSLDRIDRVLTETITLQNLSSGADGVVKLEIPKGVRLSHSEAGYSLDVGRYVEVKTEFDIKVNNVPADYEFSVYPSTCEVVLKCVFPLDGDPVSRMSFYIDYNDFLNSINGKCIPHISGLPSSVISYSMKPEVFECILKH